MFGRKKKNNEFNIPFTQNGIPMCSVPMYAPFYGESIESFFTRQMEMYIEELQLKPLDRSIRDSDFGDERLKSAVFGLYVYRLKNDAKFIEIAIKNLNEWYEDYKKSQKMKQT